VRERPLGRYRPPAKASPGVPGCVATPQEFTDWPKAGPRICIDHTGNLAEARHEAKTRAIAVLARSRPRDAKARTISGSTDFNIPTVGAR
jgi:hypothetical protein